MSLPVFSRIVTALLSAGVVFASTTACAAADGAPSREVVINDLRSPELKTYRAMLAGLDAFEAGHALAPAAPEVRFRLRRGVDNPDPEEAPLKLRISLDEDSIPVPLAPDLSFVLPRNAQAAKENGDLVLNRKKGAYRWQPEINSTGVPANMRRMGDLRLECRVLVGVIKEELAFWARALVNTVLRSTDWCNVDDINIPTYTQRKLKSAYLMDGDKRVKVHLTNNDYGFVAMIGRKVYPDDTMIVLEFADDADKQPAPAP